MAGGLGLTAVRGLIDVAFTSTSAFLFWDASWACRMKAWWLARPRSRLPACPAGVLVGLATLINRGGMVSDALPLVADMIWVAQQRGSSLVHSESDCIRIGPCNLVRGLAVVSGRSLCVPSSARQPLAVLGARTLVRPDGTFLGEAPS